MIDIYININDKNTYDNLSLIIFPFFHKCYNAQIKNVNLPINIKNRNEIIKRLKPLIDFEDYNDYITVVVRFNNKITGFKMFFIDKIKNFPKSYFSEANYFLKNVSYNSKFVLTHIT